MRRSLITSALVAGALLAPAASASASDIVISEFRTRGTAGGNDEFVEIRNKSASPVPIGGLALQGCASGTPGNASNRATVPAGVTLAPGQAYLFANSTSPGYSGATTPDTAYGTGFTDFAASNFAGIDNPLFYDPKTSMLFGDAKASVSEVLGEVQQL